MRRHSTDPDTSPMHQVSYVSSRLVRDRDRRWIEVDDAELARINAAATESTDALWALLDDLWANADNSGHTYSIGDPDSRDVPLAPGDDSRVLLESVDLPDGEVNLHPTPALPAAALPVVKDVHTEHCCALHGCKYNADDCTVARGVRQSYPCDYCGESVRWTPESLDRVADGTVAINTSGVAAQRRDGVWLVAGSTRARSSEEFLARRWVHVLTAND